MQTQSGRTLHPLVWAAGVALIVFCGAGVAAMMGWIGGPSAKTVEPAPIGQVHPAEKPHAAVKARVAAVCLECGVVQSVHEVDTKGAGSGVGAVGGGVVGGVLGHQVGDGDTQKIATVVGAVGGAVLGNEAEKQVRHTKTYEITVRFDDGAIRMITEPTAPSWHVGDKVKVVNGVIHDNS
jgi:outer membrane lipoprotein SlyB